MSVASLKLGKSRGESQAQYMPVTKAILLRDMAGGTFRISDLGHEAAI